MRKLLFLISLFGLSLSAQAVEFEIYQSEYRPLQLALVMASDEASQASGRNISSVVRNDLTSSQSFKTLDPLSFIPTPEETLKHVDYADWRIIGANNLVVCKLTTIDTGLHVEVTVYDPFQAKMLARNDFDRPADQARMLAHLVANFVYKTIIGVPGCFDSHILFVQKHGREADLMYMDQDGYNLQAVGRNFTLLLSPDWSPDGRFVALNTYVGNRPRLETFDLATGARHTFGSFKGLNSTPEYSPDGRYIAAALSYTGNTEIHIYDVKSGQWRQLTHSPGIDTTPTWSPDGKWIAFTSDRTGEPQIFRIPSKGGKAERISLAANYNTSPAWSPNGERIALITKKNWEYALATVRPDGSGLRYLVTGQRVESPAWSPNSQMVLYSAEDSGIRRVYRIPAWGGHSEAITSPNIDASDAAWSR
jgi:TolB protein